MERESADEADLVRVREFFVVVDDTAGRFILDAAWLGAVRVAKKSAARRNNPRDTQCCPWPELKGRARPGLTTASLSWRELEGVGGALELVLAEVHEVPEGPAAIGDA